MEVYNGCPSKTVYTEQAITPPKFKTQVAPPTEEKHLNFVSYLIRCNDRHSSKHRAGISNIREQVKHFNNLKTDTTFNSWD